MAGSEENRSTALALGFTGLDATLRLRLLPALLLVQRIYGAVVWFRAVPPNRA